MTHNSSIRFDVFKNYVYNYLKDSDQIEDGDELDIALKNAKDMNDIEQAIDDYWGWNDEQTVWMLASFINNVYLQGS